MLRGTRELRKYICSFVRFDPKPDLDNANVGMSEKICKKSQIKKQAASKKDIACFLFHVERCRNTQKKFKNNFEKLLEKVFRKNKI